MTGNRGALKERRLKAGIVEDVGPLRSEHLCRRQSEVWSDPHPS